MKRSRGKAVGIVALTLVMGILIYFVLHNFAYFTFILPKRVTKEQALKNFATYQTSLQEVSDKYNVKLKDITNEWFDEICEETPDNIKIFQIVLSKHENIEIRFDFSCENSEESSSLKDKGTENFDISYNIDNKSKGNFNANLFVDLANSVSGRKLSLDFCKDFLNAPESKYPASNYGLDKCDGEKIEKSYSLNFYIDWMLYYTLKDDDSEELSFGGFTKKIGIFY